MLTSIEGEVYWETAAGAAAGTRAQTYELAYEGDTMRADTGGKALLFCFVDRVITLNGPNTLAVSGRACDQGDPLPAGSGRRAQPQAGRLIAIAGSLELEGAARANGDDFGGIPHILSPRNTNLIELSPSVRWVEIPGAFEYVLHLSGLGSFPDITLEASEVDCAEAPSNSSARVCSVPWPGKWALAPDNPYFLTVSARMNLAAPLRSSEKSSLRTLDAETAGAVRDAVAAVEKLDLTPAARDLLLVNLYAEAGLYVQAVPLMERLVGVHPAPVLLVSLGDAYRATDLRYDAASAYQAALDLLDQGQDDVAVRAAAEYSLGQIEYSQLGYGRAQVHFAKAVELLTPLGVTEELAAAVYGLGRAFDSQCNTVEAEQQYDEAMTLYAELMADARLDVAEEAREAMHRRCTPAP